MNRNIGMHVETERLVLRRPTLADVPALFEFLAMRLLCSTPTLMLLFASVAAA
jgi:hypothetical protein